MSRRLTESRDKERLYEFLLGLDSEFSTIRPQILAMKPIPTLGESYHLVGEDEQQRAVSTGKKTNTESVAFQAFVRRNGAVGKQNIMGTRINRKLANEKFEHCDFCGKDGHNRDGCFKRIGYPKLWPGKGKTKTAFVEAEQHSTMSRHVENIESAIPGLSNEQYKHLLNMFSEKNSSNAEISQPMANMAGRFDEGNNWVVDSGCT